MDNWSYNRRVNALSPSPVEAEIRAAVISALKEAIGANVAIKLPDFDPSGGEQSPFAGFVGPYRYQFEGEEDLLHLVVTRGDGHPLSAEEGQEVARFLLPGMPAGLLWIRPGEFSQHFFCGHDDLVANVAS